MVSRERIAIDAARVLPRPQALAALNQLVRRGADLRVIQDLCLAHSYEFNIGRVRGLIGYVDVGCESPGESWCRCLVLDAGLPTPETQVVICGGRRRLDAAWRAYEQALEYDGREHHGMTPHQRRRDQIRREEIEGDGWDLLTVTSHQVLRRPDAFLISLGVRLRRAGWRPGAAHLREVQRRVAYIGLMYRQARLNRCLHLL